MADYLRIVRSIRQDQLGRPKQTEDTESATCGNELFGDWLMLPDASDSPGIEAPHLDGHDRWWARCGFDDLPAWPAWRGL